VVRATDGRARDSVDDAPLSEEQVSEVLEILVRCGARDYALAEARRIRDLALAAIDELPCPEEERFGLRRVAEAVIET
jgi:geranylgeranyl pyrophosphate synthase